VSQHFKWRVSPSQGYDANRYVRVVEQGVFDLLNNVWAVTLENDAKVNAPWRDRTGNARQTLAGYAVRVPQSGSVQAVFVSDGERLLPWTYDPGRGGIALILRHGMSYGKQLELARQGRFAIVGPTLDWARPQIWSSVQRMLK